MPRATDDPHMNLVAGVYAALLVSQKAMHQTMTREDLEDINEGEAGWEVRFQLIAIGDWKLWDGAPDYDTDHRGSWGSGHLGWDDSRTTIRALAEDMVSQAEEDFLA